MCCITFLLFGNRPCCGESWSKLKTEERRVKGSIESREESAFKWPAEEAILGITSNFGRQRLLWKLYDTTSMYACCRARPVHWNGMNRNRVRCFRISYTLKRKDVRYFLFQTATVQEIIFLLSSIRYLPKLTDKYLFVIYSDPQVHIQHANTIKHPTYNLEHLQIFLKAVSYVEWCFVVKQI